MALEAVLGDITEQDVDAIVNAANRELVGGGGVDGAIWMAAGHDDMMRACNELGGCEVGEAKVTPGFALKAKWVIHTVGPVWAGGGRRDERAQLAACYRNCLFTAESLGAQSIAFPAISTGVFRFPPDLAAHIAVTTLRNCERATVPLMRLVAYDEGTLHLYEKELRG